MLLDTLLSTRFSIWHTQWLQFTYFHATTMFVLAPLALSGGATLGRRERRTRADELIASTGRPRWQQITPTAAAMAVAVAGAHLLVFTGGAILVAPAATYLGAGELLLPLTDVIVLIGGAWLGLAAGRAWPSLILPPALAVASLAAQLGLKGALDSDRLDNLVLMVQPPYYDWEAVTSGALLGHLALGAGFAAAGFMLAAAVSRPLRAAAAAVLAVAVMTAAVMPGVGATARYRVDPAAQRLICADGTPQVCVTAVHAAALAQVAPEVRRALGLLAKLPGAPQRAVEWRANSVYLRDGKEPAPVPAEPGTLQFDLMVDFGQRINPILVESIVSGAGTSRSGCATSDWVARAVAGAWLMGTDSIRMSVEGPYTDQANPEVRDAVRKLRSLPEPEQTRRVTALRDAANACQQGLLAILTSEDQP